ncbi:MAG: aldose epimerase family protein [Akkermansia sp.]|nr:aldose epimerase family protein [Akkermansia sp.]
MKNIGTTAEGGSILLYKLATPELEVEITNYGARVLRYVYAGTDCLYGPKDSAQLLADTCYCGSICGRVANRIAGGKFTLDGREYTLATNNGPNHLHGGNVGFSDRLWNVEEAAETRLVLTLESPDGEEGYPGTVHVRATYTVEGRSLRLELEAATDAPTLLNLTNHAYWNLGGTGTVDTHCLKVHAQEYTPMVSNIPTGAVAPVAGTLYDLTTPACLGERNAPGAVAGGYDDNYVLPPGGGVREAALLTNGRRTLRVLTDAPGLQVYTGDYLPLPRGGVALEAQNYPDSPHHPHFPSIVLRPGETYRRTIIWEID